MATPTDIFGLVHVGVTSVCSLISVIKYVADTHRSVSPLLSKAQELVADVHECLSGIK